MFQPFCSQKVIWKTYKMNITEKEGNVHFSTPLRHDKYTLVISTNPPCHPRQSNDSVINP